MGDSAPAARPIALERPSVGRIVHFVRAERSSQIYAALVTRVEGTRIWLHCFVSGRPDLEIWVNVPHESEAEPRTHFWRWPPRV